MYCILILLGLGSVGMAAIEPLQDTFFFKYVKSKNEEKYYPIFATSGDIGNFFGKIIIAGILLFFADKYAYLIIGLIMFLIAGVCLKIKE